MNVLEEVMLNWDTMIKLNVHQQNLSEGEDAKLAAGFAWQQKNPTCHTLSSQLSNDAKRQRTTSQQ